MQKELINYWSFDNSYWLRVIDPRNWNSLSSHSFLDRTLTVKAYKIFLGSKFHEYIVTDSVFGLFSKKAYWNNNNNKSRHEFFKNINKLKNYET